MNSEVLEKVESLAGWIADQYEKPRGDSGSTLIRQRVEVIAKGSPGDKVYYHGDPIKYEDAAEYLRSLASHTKALQDSIPKHIDPQLWHDKLWELARTIKSL